jgi:hypothetical protein
MSGHAWPFANCTLAKFLEEEQFGPAPPGYKYACKVGALPEPVGFFSVVYTVGVAATYLVQTVHERTGAYADDNEITTTHWRWDNGGDPDDSDFLIVEARLDGFWSGIAYLRTTNISVLEHRWYVADPAPGPPNPTVKVTASGIPGTSTAAELPPQCASTVTLRTDVRRRWGRFYVGGFTTAMLSTHGGDVHSDQVDGIADLASAAFFNSATNWRIQVFGGGSPASLPVRSIEVDNVWDVQRRRRKQLTTHKNVQTLDT